MKTLSTPTPPPPLPVPRRKVVEKLAKKKLRRYG